MAKNNRPNPKLQGLPKFEQWLYVRRLYGLTHAQVRMAMDLSMGPFQIASHERRRIRKRLPKVRKFIESRYRNRFGTVLTDAPSLEEQREAKQKARAAYLAGKHVTSNAKPGPLNQKEWNRARARFHLSEEYLAKAKATGLTPTLMDQIATGRATRRRPGDPLPLHATEGQIRKIKRVIRERYAAMVESASSATDAVPATESAIRPASAVGS